MVAPNSFVVLQQVDTSPWEGGNHCLVGSFALRTKNPPNRGCRPTGGASPPPRPFLRGGGPPQGIPRTKRGDINPDRREGVWDFSNVRIPADARTFGGADRLGGVIWGRNPCNVARLRFTTSKSGICHLSRTGKVEGALPPSPDEEPKLPSLPPKGKDPPKGGEEGNQIPGRGEFVKPLRQN
ncbi:hypothetical protein RRG08_000241 [Elysia crispata]|uniref:Uncharacterized protein n=1 Tax=Elysia crispata TaxID=231223 RepID=A0AAE1AWM2_9GAST|nr:hypothetical protein RRG08_000241 [Elysia crispata]